jgi:ABC-type polysaccharide/polyol phosphate export permease
MVATHLRIVRLQIVDMIINVYVWVLCSLLTMGYLMQSFGLASDYGLFMFGGMIGAIGIFEVYGSVTKNVMDFDGDQVISYYLTLPTRPWIIFGSMVCSYALVGIILSLLIIPFGALVLYDSAMLSAISWVKAVGIIVISNIFLGVFTLMITTHIKSILKMGNVWIRFIFPLWVLGCYQFSWSVVYKKSAFLAYVMLLNPFVFIMEGTRAAIIGQNGFLPWSVCCGVLCGVTVVMSLYTYRRLRTRLDFV